MAQKFLFFLIISLLLIKTVNAAWKGPVEVVSGSWGSKPGEFKSDHDDTQGLISPDEFCVTAAGYIVISDHLNFRIQVFKPNGTLYAVFGPKNIPKTAYQDQWPTKIECFSDSIYVQHGTYRQVYKLNGSLKPKWKKFVGGLHAILPDDSFVSYYNPNYYKYSATGRLLKTYTAKPPELGEIVSGDKQDDGSYKMVVKFDNVTYKLRAPSRFVEYFRDSLGYLNVWFDIEEEPRHSRVSKYDIHGNLIASIDSLGTPIITINGDAYVSSDEKNYSILKWTWQSEPPRQPPPAILEIPRFFEVSRASRSIDIDWSAPEQDEKCKIGYEIFRADTPGGPYELIASPEKSGTYEDKVTVPGRVYYYKMRAFCGDKYSEFTKELKRRR